MSDRKCPECGEKLSFDALRCACGWGVRKGEKAGKLYNHRCTYHAGQERCSYPVGMFPEGASSGWCIFHRQQPNQHVGAEVVRQSRTVPYLEALQPLLEHHKNGYGTVNTAHAIALHRGNTDDPKPFADAMQALKRGAA